MSVGSPTNPQNWASALGRGNQNEVVQFEIQGVSITSGLWQTVGMAEKRTKADKEQRQADQLDKKAERRPEQGMRKKKVRNDSSRAA